MHARGGCDLAVSPVPTPKHGLPCSKQGPAPVAGTGPLPVLAGGVNPGHGPFAKHSAGLPPRPRTHHFTQVVLGEGVTGPERHVLVARRVFAKGLEPGQG